MSDTAEPAAPSAPSGEGRGRLVVLVVFGLLLGLLLARFLTGGGGTGDLPPATPAGVSAEERLVRLRADVEQDPDSLQAWQEIASLAIQQAQLTGDPSWYPQATQALDEAERIAPDDLATRIVRGNLQLVQHEFAEANRTGQMVLDQAPGNIGALTVLVDAQVELGQYDRAAETLQELLDLRPSLPALARTSYLRELNGDLDGALQAMQQAVSAGSGSATDLANVTTLLGDLQLRRGEYDRADEAYRQARESSPDFVPARIGQARLQASRGDLPGAVDALRSLTDQTPSPSALTLLLELQQASGDGEAAADTLEVLRAVTVLQAESGQVVDLELAEVEVTAGDPTQGFQLAQQTYTARPTIFAASVLGWALTQTDGPGAAERYVRQSLELGSLDPVLNYRAARVLADLGQTDDATEALERALAHDPSGTFRHRGDIGDLAEELDVPLPQAWRTAVDS